MRPAPMKILLPILLTFSVISAPAHSQSLFDQGKKLLDGFGGSKSGAAALRVGSDRVFGTLGKTDGFNKSGDVHIPLPGSLKNVQSMLSKVGMSGLADDLELRLNRAAEAAVPKARKLFFDAISAMTIDDARKILNGPKGSATQYFRGKMSSPLRGEMKPIVDTQLS